MYLSFLTLLATSVRAVPVVNVRGADFVDSNSGARFLIVGVAYQPGGSSGYDPQSGIDPLTNGSDCLRDAALLQRLGL